MSPFRAELADEHKLIGEWLDGFGQRKPKRATRQRVPAEPAKERHQRQGHWPRLEQVLCQLKQIPSVTWEREDAQCYMYVGKREKTGRQRQEEATTDT